LKHVSLPSTITSFSSGAFRNCVSLSNLTILSSLDVINTDAFEGCVSLAYIKYEGKNDPCNDSLYYRKDRFNTCESLDIVCVPLDYNGTTFCDKPICKTTHCEEEVSKYNHCYELVKCGEPDAEIRMRANATKWIGQTDGCVEYVCINDTGRASWSNCNNSMCVEGTCANDAKINGQEQLKVVLVVQMEVNNWSRVEAKMQIGNIGTTDTTNESRLGIGMNAGGDINQVVMMTNDRNAADLVSTVATRCSHDPDTPVIYDDMCDEFPCTGFMHHIERVYITEIENLELSEAPIGQANQRLLFILISFLVIAAYLM